MDWFLPSAARKKFDILWLDSSISMLYPAVQKGACALTVSSPRNVEQ